MSICSSRNHSTRHRPRVGGLCRAHPDPGRHLPVKPHSPDGLGGEMPQWQRTGDVGIPKRQWDPQTPSIAEDEWDTSHLRLNHRFTCTHMSRLQLEEVRKRFLDQQVFLLIFMNYIQQSRSPCPTHSVFGRAPPDHPTHSIKILLGTWFLFHRLGSYGQGHVLLHLWLLSSWLVTGTQ